MSDKERTLLVDLHYFGNIDYYKNLSSHRYIEFSKYQPHQKSSFANRCVVAGANGKVTLSIPLERGRDQRAYFKDLKIYNMENWQQRHFRTLTSAYNSGPWFKYVSDELAALYSRHFEFLMDWNLACFEWTLKILKYHPAYGWSDLMPGEESTETRDFRGVISPKSAFGTTKYTQVFQDRNGFLPGLSILDLIFCEGPKSALALLREGG